MKLKNLIQPGLFIIALSILIQSCGGREVKEAADLVLTNAVIATMDESNPSDRKSVV